MAVKAHDGNFGIDSIVGYESYGTFYGVKILEEVYITELNEYRYIVQHGKAREGSDFEPYDGELELLTRKYTNETYPNKYVKVSPLKDGDVLVDASMKQVFVVKGKNLAGTPRLHRILGGAYAWGNRKDYEDQYGKLTVVKDNMGELFSKK